MFSQKNMNFLMKVKLSKTEIHKQLVLETHKLHILCVLSLVFISSELVITILFGSQKKKKNLRKKENLINFDFFYLNFYV